MQTHFKNFFLVDHPLIKKDITLLRNVETDCENFRYAVSRISNIIAVKLCEDLRIRSVPVITPLEKTDGYQIIENVVIVPVLRAGLGMVNGFLQIIPDDKVGHIGLERD